MMTVPKRATEANISAHINHLLYSIYYMNELSAYYTTTYILL